MPRKEPRQYRRQFPRQKADLRLTLTDEHGTHYHGRCSSISEGGFRAVLAGELALGSIVTVEFLPPRSQLPVRLIARLCHRTGFEHGFEFIAPTSEQRDMIAEFFRDNVDSES